MLGIPGNYVFVPLIVFIIYPKWSLSASLLSLFKYMLKVGALDPP